MIRYLVLRLAGFAGVLLCVSAITFVLMRLVPGGPFDSGEVTLAPEAKAAILRAHGLDQPLPVQYLRFLSGALRGDLGTPLQSPGETVLQLIGRAGPVTLHLAAMSLAIAVAGGVLLGTVAAYRTNDMWGTAASILCLGSLAVPPFSLAVLLLLTLGRWLPSGGWGGPETWVLPVLANGLAPMGIVGSYTRVCVRDALLAEYVRTARAKGLGPARLAVHHVLRNASIPLLTVGGQLALALLTGTVFVESIFRIPGLGGFYVSSIFKRDYAMIMGLTLLAAAVVSLTFLIVDLLYVAADPRIRLGERARA